MKRTTKYKQQRKAQIAALVLVCAYLFAFVQLHVMHDHSHTHSHDSEISVAAASSNSHHHSNSEIKEKCSICDKQIAKVFTLAASEEPSSSLQSNSFALFSEYNALRIAVELRSDRGPPSC